MKELDERICNAIKRLDEYFGPLNYVICGSIGLYIQGIYLDREPHDLDIIIPNNRDQGLLKRLFRIAYKSSGFILDFPIRPLQGNEEIITVKFNDLTVNVQEKHNILLCKQIIVNNHLFASKSEEKQKQDILKIKLTLNNGTDYSQRK